MKRALTNLAFALSLLLLFFLPFQYLRHVAIPQSRHLIDCTNTIVEFCLRVPAGRDYQLVLANRHLNTNSFEGTVSIQGEHNLSNKFLTFVICSEQAVDCNWLNKHEFAWTKGVSYRKPASDVFQKLMKPDYDLKFTIQFYKAPASNSSLWLYWKQPRHLVSNP